MKKIGLVMHPYGEKYPAGLGRAIFSMVKNIIELDTSDRHYTIFLKGEGHAKPKISGNNWEYVELPSQRFWLDFGLRKYKDLDLFVFFTPVIPFSLRLKKTIVVAHDFSYVHLKPQKLFRLLFNKVLFYYHKISLIRASKIIAISDYTKKEIISLFNIDPNKIKVILNGFIPRNFKNERPIEEKKIFLFVGVLKHRKNILRLIEAYNQYVVATKNPKSLFLVGKGGGSYYQEIIQLINKLNLKDLVALKGYLNETELDEVYSRTFGFIFPSLCEGFGLPVIESMSLGIPVITSQTTSLGEVSGDAAILVDPLDVNAISEAMVFLDSRKDIYDDLVKKGYERSSFFSWEKAGRTYIEEIDTMLKYND